MTNLTYGIGACEAGNLIIGGQVAQKIGLTANKNHADVSHLNISVCMDGC